jgi:hypothetical protein
MGVKLLGYYINCDDALCKDCAHRRYVFSDLPLPLTQGEGEGDSWDILVRAWKAAGGFESWDEPAAIFDDSEADSPTHCAECEELIPHALTSHGYDYVREHIIEELKPGEVRHPDSLKVVREWWEQYGDDMSEAEVAEIAAKCFDLTELIDKALGVEQ